MTYHINMNIVKMTEWSITYNEGSVLYKIIELPKWANKINVDGDEYYLLYRNKLLEEIPPLGTTRTISRIYKNLESKGLIKSVLKNTTPAYRVTEKGLEWMETKPKYIHSKEEKSRPTFRLEVLTEYDDLEEKYIEFLEHGAKDYCKTHRYPTNIYDDFVNFNKANGNSYKNWASAFKSWCSKAKKLKKKNTGNSNGFNLYNIEL